VTDRRLIACLLVAAAGAGSCSPGEDEVVVELCSFGPYAVEGTATLSDGGERRTRIRIEVAGSPPALEARLRVSGCRGDDRFTMDVRDGSGDATAPYELDDIGTPDQAFVTVHGRGGVIVACGRVRD
jgi:hypothetical protein